MNEAQADAVLRAAIPVPEPSHMKHTELRTHLKRSAIFAAWWVFHFLLASMLLQFALGDFVNGDSTSGAFEPASMAQVMQHLSLPLAPPLAFGLLFLTLTGLAYAVALLWRRLLRVLDATEADALTAQGLRWTIRQQLLTAWLLAPLVLTGLAWWAVHKQHTGAAIGLVTFIAYGLPLLVLRPRWLGLASSDRSWLPSVAALGIYLVGVVLYFAVDAIPMDRYQTAGLGLDLIVDLMVSWLSASALIFVRSRHEVIPHLASRLNRRFAFFVALAFARPARVIVVWLLPPILLVSYYAIFIAPSVAELAGHVPDFAVSMHRMLGRAINVFTKYWWLGFFPVVSTALALYTGRCLVLFDARDRADITSRE